MKDVADDLALIVRNAIAYIKELERQVNDLKREAEPVQEPVKQCMAHGECFGGECIYTSPPQRKPLSDADLVKIWDDALDQLDQRDQLRFIARAIERAHGIKE